MLKKPVANFVLWAQNIGISLGLDMHVNILIASVYNHVTALKHTQKRSKRNAFPTHALRYIQIH